MTFEDWWGDDPKHGAITAREAWDAAQQAERERIKRIVQEVNTQVDHNIWASCVSEILKEIEE